jgi:hypothetical protein
MSYKLKILKDHPIAYYPLTEIYNATIKTYQDIKDDYATYQAFENDFLTYLNVIDTIVYDASGCGNNGLYVGTIYTNCLPLVSGGVFGTIINSTSSITLSTTKDFYGSTVSGGFANKYTSQNNFSLEAWVYPKISSTARTILMADNTAGIGLYYEAGSLVFRLQDQELYYTLNNTNKVMHVVATYSQSSMSLYVDGYNVATKSITGFKFTNTELALAIGPSTGSDYFVVDAPAIYREALSSEVIRSHFVAGTYHVNPIQFVRTDGGKLFNLNDEFIKPVYRYSLNNLQNYVNDNVYYDKTNQALAFYKTDTVIAKSVEINEIINIPVDLGANTSKVYWKADKNITVESSVDGITYTQCENGKALPNYNKSAAISTNVIFLRITMSTTDASKYLPKLSSVKVDFYASVDTYSENSGYYATSTSDYSLGSFNYPPLLRHKNNGLQTKSGAGFNIPVTDSVSTIEMFFTPSTLTANTLFDVASQGAYTASGYSWANNGTITKTNILKIYVNGVDLTSQTNISSVFLTDNLHYVVLVLTQPCSGTLKFNYSNTGGPSSLYKNIAIYNYQMSEALATEHYGSYISRPKALISDTSFTLTDSAPKVYNSDWVVIQTI